MTLIQSANPDWSFKPAWSVLYSREEVGGDGPLLSLSATHGVRERVEGEGRAASEDTSGYRVVTPGDIVINRLVARDGAISMSPLAGKISPAYWVLRTSDHVDAGFVSYLLNSSPYLMEIGARSKSMPPAQFDLPWDQFRTLPIACPPLSTQRAIADFLDAETERIDALIAKKERMVELLQYRWRSHLVDQVAPHFQSMVVPQHWSNGRLRNLVDRVTGGSWGVEPGDAALDAPCVRAADFDFVRLAAASGATRSFGVNEMEARRLVPGDLVLEKSGGGDEAPVGRVVMWLGEVAAVPTNFAARIRAAGSNDPWFVLFAFRAAYQVGLNWKSIKQTTGIQNLDTRSYLAEPWPIPPTGEQRELATELRDSLATTNEACERIRSQVALLRERRQALITAAVTGELDIPGVAA